MKKLNFISLLLLAGCANTLSSMELFTLNQDSKSIPHDFKVYSCETLKTKSYDVFYSDENQKCLKNAGIELETADAKSKKAQTDEDVLQASKILLKTMNKIQSCKATEDLTLRELNKFGSPLHPNYNIINYYKSAYNKCGSSNLFDKDKINRLNTVYASIIDLQKTQYNIEQNLAKTEKKLGHSKARDEKFAKFLTTIDSNSVLSKLKQAAPDFIQTKLSTMNMTCPLIYYIEALQNFGSITNSTLADTSNYKFSKKDANTLVMKAGNMEMTFVKSGDIVNATVMKGKNQKGQTETSTNTFGNNWHAMEACLQQQDMH